MPDGAPHAGSAQQEITSRLLRQTRAALPTDLNLAAVSHSVDQAGPVAAHLPDERAVQAACGIMQVHGRATGRPLPLAVDYAATVAGVLAAQGVCAAFLARHRGLGLRHVATSASQGALLALTQYLAAATADGGPDGDDGTGMASLAYETTAEAAPAPRLTPVTAPSTEGGRALPSPAQGPGSRPRHGVDVRSAQPRTATLFSADGTPFELETLDPEAWREFWQRLGAPPALAGRGWGSFQQRFATGVCDLPSQLREAAAAAPLTTLQEAADVVGVSLVALADDPHPAGLPEPWTLAPAPGDSATSTIGAPSPAHGPLPPATGPLPLSGIRVVESTRRVQGPLIGHVLQLLGADVTRIEPPGGDPMRGLAPLTGGCSARFSALNAGKSVAEADITTAAGRRTVHELVAEADVFVHNWAPGRAARLGLDASTLWRTRPGLVQAAASGFGAAFAPSPPPIGTDYLAQVHSGLAAALRPAGETPAPSLMTLTDVLGGLVCAQGVLSALLVRARTGQGALVDSSLFSAAALVPRPPKREHWTPFDLPLRTADGYLVLDGAGRSQPAKVARIADTGSGTATSCPEAVAGRFAQRSTGEWVARLHDGGVTATPVCTDLAALPKNPTFGAAVVPATPQRPARPCSPWEFS